LRKIIYHEHTNTASLHCFIPLDISTCRYDQLPARIELRQKRPHNEITILPNEISFRNTAEPVLIIGQNLENRLYLLLLLFLFGSQSFPRTGRVKPAMIFIPFPAGWQCPKDPLRLSVLTVEIDLRRSTTF
jgi:hypothetical protein